jgi:hypothetical protein
MEFNQGRDTHDSLSGTGVFLYPILLWRRYKLGPLGSEEENAESMWKERFYEWIQTWIRCKLS